VGPAFSQAFARSAEHLPSTGSGVTERLLPEAGKARPKKDEVSMHLVREYYVVFESWISLPSADLGLRAK
jgi:hypothetical protein